MKPRLIRSADYALMCIDRVLGTNVRAFVRDAFIVTISHGVGILRGIATGYLVARLFPREAYGSYQFILSVVGSMVVFSLPGIDQSLSRAVARGNPKVVLPVARRHFLICLPVTVILLGAIPFLPYFGREDLWPLFVLAAILFPLTQPASTMFHGLTTGLRRFDVSLRANITWSIAMVVATGLILYFDPSPFLFYGAITLLPAIAYAYYSTTLIHRPENKSEASAIIAYGTQITLAQLPILLSWYVDKLLISAYLGLNQLALFSVAILIPEQVKTWTKELLPISFAVQARGDDSWERRSRLIKLVLRSTVISVAGIAAYIVIAPFAMPLLFPTYPDAVFLSQIAAVTLVTQPGALLTQYLEAQAMLRAQQWTQWISASVFVLSLVIMIPQFGLLGAVIARGMLRLSYSICALFFLWTMEPVKAQK